jgi:hypothetical protein
MDENGIVYMPADDVIELQKLDWKTHDAWQLYRAKRRLFELFRCEWHEVEEARSEYERLAKEYQQARKNAGLPYVESEGV